MLKRSHQEVFLRKSILEICSKFAGDHPCQSVISIKLLWNFIEIALQHGCSPVNLLHIFRTPFLKNTSGQLLVNVILFQLQCYHLNPLLLDIICNLLNLFHAKENWVKKIYETALSSGDCENHHQNYIWY